MVETKKIAVIINGDTGSLQLEYHRENVERALQNVLNPQGYETWVASPSKPSAPADHYFSGDREGVQELLDQLSKTAGSNTELVIYTTGHGDVEGFCLEEDCKTEDLLTRLDALPFEKKRVVVMDQCYGGGFGKLFLDNPKTLFTSAGSRGETDICQEIAPYLWAPVKEVPDENKDGVISWEERFDYALKGRPISSEPQFVFSPGYVEGGKPAFPEKVSEITDNAGLKEALGQLHPGQYGVITFSADWCGPCQKYKPVFEQMAKEGGGQLLWMRTENETLAKAWGVKRYPTVMIVSWRGDQRVVENIDAVPEEVALFEAPLEDRLMRRITAAGKIGYVWDRADALIDISSALAEAKLNDKAVAVFEKLIAAAEKIWVDERRAYVLSYIASAFLFQAELNDKSVAVFEKLVAAAEKIGDDRERASVLKTIVLTLASAKLNDKAVEVFEKLIAAVEKIGDDRERACVLSDIAYVLDKAGLSNRLLVPLN